MALIENENDGVAFLVSAGLVYEAIAKACSSPQTAEINADKRAATLMKWVNIGTVEGLALVAVAAFVFARKRPFAFVAGGVAAASITYVEYLHAKKSGLANGGPTTETW